MKWLFAMLVVVAVIALVVLKRRDKSSNGEGERLPYALEEGLFSPAERSFLGVLDQALGKNYRVFGKVRIADVVTVQKGTPKSLWQRAFNRISAKHFDFVLCTPDDLKPVCAIELNDQSHARDSRKGRDKFLEDVCVAARLPLVFFAARRTYTLSEVCQAIANAMDGREVIAAGVEDGLASSSGPDAATTTLGSATADPVCPRCSSPMVRRIAKSGENAGKEFWGCTRFPACRGVVLL